MPAVAKLSMDLLFGILCVVGSPIQEGTIYTVMITDRGPVDAGTVEMTGGAVTFFDGIGANKVKVMSLTSLASNRSRFRFEHRVEPSVEIAVDEVVLNRTDFDATATQSFQFRIADGRIVKFTRMRDVIYLHLDGTPNTIVLQK